MELLHVVLLVLPSLVISLAPTTGLASVSQRREAVLDGAEWASVRRILRPQDSRTACGRMTVVAGTSLDSDVRVVGIEAPASDGTFASAVYKESIAEIPRNIKDDVAISTLVASLSSIHCALPTDAGADPKVVVVGGSDFACFAARGLAVNGASVSLVSTSDPQVDDYRVMCFGPAVGELEVGFCDHIGQFDSMVDTVSDEQGQAEAAVDDEDLIDRSYSVVLALLKSRHGCSRYVSTMTMSQRIARDNGVFFGPGKVKDHVKEITGTGHPATPIVPPEGFGATVQTLLSKGVTYSLKPEGDTIVRMWSLPNFWELASWPRDASGANIRFGLPVIDDLDVLVDEEEEEEEEEENDVTSPSKNGGNPFLVEIEGVQGLSREVIDPEKDCILFLSATYCRTCKTLGPAYTRYARQNQSESLIFGKADTTKAVGKELGKKLAVNAVPLFVFFRKGRRFGKPLSINKLPSKKMDLAFDFLTTGAEWDSEALDAVKERKNSRK